MSRLRPGNVLQLLVCGVQYFPALEQAIDEAEKEIFLETYIFADDETGERIASALARAAARGVRVRVLVDGFGGREFEHTHQPVLDEAGVHTLIFRPEVARLSMRRNRLRRMHRKLCVVDGRIGFVGGINIIDDMHTPGQTPPRFDYAVRVCGPLVTNMHIECQKLWERVAWATLQFRPRLQPLDRYRNKRIGDVRAALLVRDNLRHRHDIEDAYMDAIASATRDITIANAYFLPGRRFRQALIHAAARGVKVTLILQGRVEYALLHYASQALYGSLLSRGVRIFEYRRSFLHAKAAVIDDDWATVGSSNIDPFSLMLAREANIVVRDAGFTGELRQSLEAAATHGGRELRHRQWQHRPLHERLMRWLAYGMVRIMIGIAGERLSRHMQRRR
ncbi:MAG: cardiolipin synthase ClsB [Gammaproteobacteria bacterium]|jgi:cardiolipin synthase A/B|nr:cardiolipin synthase ClsB [Gammaproteobacteria bacterium]MBU0770730.1 cardiolipin synthase ClsB [Gammaproteobacteria bacterium]MBU0857604.1 cardiolipin synthase ClsB [Gammaproteobacteria bacterium]MBU1848652.1 cardiolipin synthase ClsB [Gammaproteobacteria bacterium]